MIASYCI